MHRPRKNSKILVMIRLLNLVLIALFTIENAVGAASSSAAVVRSEPSIFRNLMENARISSIAGAFSCSITHSAVVPLDVVKTKMQCDSAYKGLTTRQSAKKMVADKGGLGLLLQGLSATSVGYFCQGACKFGVFEMLKGALAQLPGYNPEGPWRVPGLIAASSLAETVACLTLTPLERARIQMVVHKQPSLVACMRGLLAESGFRGLYVGLRPIMLKQIPYTAVKLTGYELLRRPVAELLERASGGRLSEEQRGFLTGLAAGVVAGVAAAAVSQPADVLLSRVCGGNAALAECVILDSVGALAQELRAIGLRGCYAGLKPRAVMVGALTAGQMVLYEEAKRGVRGLGLRGLGGGAGAPLLTADAAAGGGAAAAGGEEGEGPAGRRRSGGGAGQAAAAALLRPAAPPAR